MADKDKLISARNLIRYLFDEVGDAINDHCADNLEFFNHLISEGKKIGVVEEPSPGFFAITKEKYNTGPRHFGKGRTK